MEKNITSKQKARLFFFSVMTMAALSSVLWIQQGCTGNYAPIAKMVATATPTLQPDVISNFNAGTTAVNPTLSGTTQQVVVAGGASGTNVNGNSGSVTVSRNFAGYFSVNTYGGNVDLLYTPTPNPSISPTATPDATPVTVVIPPNKINSPFLLPNPGDGSNYAININCPLYDPPPSSYPADDLICNLVSGGTSPYFDATGFNGIQFDLNILPDDTNTNRVFQVAVDVTTTTSILGGTCTTGGCYNYHQAVLPAGSTGGWVHEKYAWSSIVYPGFGNNTGALSTHLSKVIFLQWGFSDNGGTHNTQTDFWIDNVSFY